MQESGYRDGLEMVARQKSGSRILEGPIMHVVTRRRSISEVVGRGEPTSRRRNKEEVVMVTVAVAEPLRSSSRITEGPTR